MTDFGCLFGLREVLGAIGLLGVVGLLRLLGVLGTLGLLGVIEALGLLGVLGLLWLELGLEEVRDGRRDVIGRQSESSAPLASDFHDLVRLRGIDEVGHQSQDIVGQTDFRAAVARKNLLTEAATPGGLELMVVERIERQAAVVGDTELELGARRIEAELTGLRFSEGHTCAHAQHHVALASDQVPLRCPMYYPRLSHPPPSLMVGFLVRKVSRAVAQSPGFASSHQGMNTPRNDRGVAESSSAPLIRARRRAALRQVQRGKPESCERSLPDSRCTGDTRLHWLTTIVRVPLRL